MAWRLMPVRWPFAVRARLKGPVRAACEALERRAYFAAAFGAATPLPVNKQLAGNTIRSVASGDFNADGNEDLAVVNTQDNGIDILLNGGNGQFTLKSVLPDGGGQVTGLAAADLGNGKIDIVASNVTTGSLYVFIGSGNGTFAAPAIYKFGTPQSGTVAATDLVTVASLFGTTSSDLIVADDVDARIVTFRNLGTGVFTAAQSLATPTPGSVIVGDFFNATGLRYAVTNTGQAFVIGTTGTITRLGALNFSLPTDQAYVGTGTVATADFNNDGIADIARIFVGADGKSYLDIVPGGKRQPGKRHTFADHHRRNHSGGGGFQCRWE